MSEVESVVAINEAALEKEQAEKDSTVATKNAIEGAAAAAKATDESTNATAESPPPPAKTPVKRTPSKRMSFIERAQKESEELVKTLGGSLEMEGGRRTRSSNRSTPTRAAVVTPPPAKKSRSSPATPAPRGGRGRARKIINADSNEDVSKGETPEKSMEDPSDKVDTNANTNTKNENTAAKDADEKVPDEKVDDEPAAASKEQDEHVKGNGGKEEDKASVETAVDSTDAVLKTLQEEQQNDIDHKIEDKQAEEPAAATSAVVVPEEKPEPAQEPPPEPMETDVSEHVEATETVADTAKIPETEAAASTVEPISQSDVNASIKCAKAPESEKQPTPEPMEVDSVTISDDSEPQTIDDDTADDVVHVPDHTETLDEIKKATPAAEVVTAAPQETVSNEVVDLDSSLSELESIVDGAPKETEIDTALPLVADAPEENNIKDTPTPAVVANNNDVTALSSSVENDVQTKPVNAENDNISSKVVSPDQADNTTISTGIDSDLESAKKIENKTNCSVLPLTIPDLTDGAVSSPQLLN